MGKSKDSIELVKTDLQIDEKIKAHKDGWAAQRVGMIFIFVFLLAALVGLFGNGLLSKREIVRDNITVESQRFYRFQARMELKIRTTNVQSDGATITFPNAYLQKMRIESILPEPKENRIGDGNVSYVFEGSGNMDITFYLSPEAQGSVRGVIAVNGHPFELKHFIYP